MAAATFGTLNKPGTSGFSFGSTGATPTTGTTGTSGLFGNAFASAPPSGVGFGSATRPATTTGSLSLGGFGASTTPATISGFGQPSTTSSAMGGFTFGQPTASSLAASSAPNVLSLSGLQTVNPSSGTSLFGASQTKPAATSFNLLGTATTSTPSLGLGGVGTSSTTATGGVGLFSALSKAPTATTGLALTSISGLGGTGTSSTASLSGTVSGIAGKQSEIQNLKDNQVPDPLVKIVEEFKNYVKQQREHRDEISRFSVSNIQKVQEETMSLRQSLSVVSNSIQRDACAVENLKMDVAQELKNAEIAQHTSEIPPALQHENIAPQDYFQRLVESFEERMQIYRKQIEIMESHLASLSQGQTLTPQDLSQVMHKVHETFIALAAQLHGIHEAVKLQKEHYLNYRKAYFKDSTDVFTTRIRSLAKPSAPVSVGPSPFNSNGLTYNTGASRIQASGLGSSGFGMNRLNTTGNPLTMSTGFGTSTGLGSTFGTGLNPSSLGTTGVLGASSGFGTGIGFKGLGTQASGTTTGFGVQASKPATGFSFGTPSNTTFGSPFGVSATATATPFELQKPPAGNKRGKKR